MNIFRFALLVAASLWAQVPDSGTRHDRRSSYLELGVSANAGFPDVFRPQLEMMAKHRGLPVFVSGRLGIGAGDWIGHSTLFVTPQLALHWTNDGDNSWALRLGWVMGQWMGTRVVPDSTPGHTGVAKSRLLGNSIAVERTSYFKMFPNVAWRASLGAATAWHQYEYMGAVVESRESFVTPFVDLGLLWTLF